LPNVAGRRNFPAKKVADVPDAIHVDPSASISDHPTDDSVIHTVSTFVAKVYERGRFRCTPNPAPHMAGPIR
jgi:hypothetical protein